MLTWSLEILLQSSMLEIVQYYWRVCLLTGMGKKNTWQCPSVLGDSILSMGFWNVRHGRTFVASEFICHNYLIHKLFRDLCNINWWKNPVPWVHWSTKKYLEPKYILSHDCSWRSKPCPSMTPKWIFFFHSMHSHEYFSGKHAEVSILGMSFTVIKFEQN